MNLPMLTYIWCIIVGALLIFFPGGGHICIACGSIIDTIAGIISIVLGVAGFAMRGQAVAVR